jgi:DNA-binding ferritin-like protein
MTITLLKSPALGEASRPGESERDFRIRLQTASRETRDGMIDRISRKYTAKIAALEERIRKAEQAVDREKEQAKQQKLQTALSLGATIFDAMLSRKKVSRSTVGRASTTAGRAGRILKENKDVERAEENVDELKRQLAELQALLAEESGEAKKGIDPLTEPLEQFHIKPKKKDIAVVLTALVWVPYQETDTGGIIPVW